MEELLLWSHSLRKTVDHWVRNLLSTLYHKYTIQRECHCSTCIKHMLVSLGCMYPACASHSLVSWWPVWQYRGPDKSWFCQASPVSLHKRVSTDLTRAPSNDMQASTWMMEMFSYIQKKKIKLWHKFPFLLMYNKKQPACFCVMVHKTQHKPHIIIFTLWCFMLS